MPFSFGPWAVNTNR